MVNGQFGRPARGMGFGLGMQMVLDPVAADLAVSKNAFSWPGGSGVAFWVEPEEELVSIYMIQGGSGARCGARSRSRSGKPSSTDGAEQKKAHGVRKRRAQSHSLTKTKTLKLYATPGFRRSLGQNRTPETSA